MRRLLPYGGDGREVGLTGTHDAEMLRPMRIRIAVAVACASALVSQVAAIRRAEA